VRLIETYKWICEEVRKAENRYEGASTVLGSERPFGQVGLLWQIFGIEERVEEEGHRDTEEGSEGEEEEGEEGESEEEEEEDGTEEEEEESDHASTSDH